MVGGEKMSFVSDLMVSLGIDTKNFTAGIKNASKSADTFGKNMANSFKKASNGSNKANNDFNILAKQTASAFKDVSRITQGILVSQAFYRSINAIQEATGAVWEMSKSFENASVSFGMLLKDQAKADRFLTMIEDFAAETPFTFQAAADNARKLLAYGFSSDTMKPLLTSISDAAAASGDTETFNRIGRALGQIQTKGRLASQELLQLTEAGIPAFQILKEELGLTSDQVAEIGSMRIPADAAINALITGINKRYGGAGDALSKTMGGIISTLKDNLLIIGKDIYSDSYDKLKAKLAEISESVSRFKEIVRGQGFGGLMRELVPPEIFPKLQLFVANVKNLSYSFKLASQALKPFIDSIGLFLLNAFNLVMPVINVVARVIAVLGGIVSNSSGFVRGLVGAIGGLAIAGAVTGIIMGFGAAIKSLFIVKAAAQGIIYLAQAIRVLTIAMMANPWIAVATIAAGALLSLAMAGKKTSKSLDVTSAGINKVLGQDPKDQFKEKMKDNTKSTDEFNKSIGGAGDSVDKFADKSKGAAKKAREALMAFDEVFNLPEESADEGSGALDDLDTGMPIDMIPEVGGIDLGELPTPGDMFGDWMSNIKEWLSNAWSTVMNSSFVKWAGDSLKQFADWNIASYGIFFKWAGDTAKSVADWASTTTKSISDWSFNTAKQLLDWEVSTAKGFGTWVIDTGKQFLQWVDDSGKGFEEWVKFSSKLFVDWCADTFSQLSTWTVDTLAGIGQWTIDTALSMSTWATDTLKGFSDWVIDSSKAFYDWWVDTAKGFGDWFIDTLKGFVGWAKDTVEKLGTWAIDSLKALTDWKSWSWTALSQWFTDTVKGFGQWATDTLSGLGTWALDSTKALADWAVETAKGFATWASDTLKEFGQWAKDTLKGIGQWVLDTKEGIRKWSEDTKKAFADWALDTIVGLAAWALDAKEKLATWWRETVKGFTTWVADSKKALDEWWRETQKGFTNWVTDTSKSVATWATDTAKGISTWVTETKKTFDSWLAGTEKGFSDWWTNTYKGFSTWAKDTYTEVFGWWDKLMDKLSGFWEKLKFWEGESSKAQSNLSSAANSYEAAYQAAKSSSSTAGSSMLGHARGGMFNKQHVANFAEGNKLEAILPVENEGAMAQVRRAIFGGEPADFFESIIANMPDTSSGGGYSGQALQPLYVGTLIADERGLKELERKMEIIRIQEDTRKGGPGKR